MKFIYQAQCQITDLSISQFKQVLMMNLHQ